MAHNDVQKVYLVCEHKTNGRMLVPDGLSVLDEEELVMIISANPDMCMVTKAIEPGCTSIDIYKIDLVPNTEKAMFEKQINKEKAKGKDEVPWKEFLGHSWEGHTFDEVVILVPDDAVPKVEGVGEETTEGSQT